METGEKYQNTRRSAGYELDIRNAFSHLTHIFKIREWTDDEREQYKGFSTLLPAENIISDEEAKEYGIEYFDGDIFYVLRKPI